MDLVRSEVRSLAPYVAGKAPQPRKGRTLKLASNENLVIDNSDVNRFLVKVLRSSLAYYPDSHQHDLKEAISAFLLRYHYEVSPDQIVLGDGSGETIQMVMEALVAPGEGVCIPEKSFSLYRSRALLAGATVVEVKRREDFSIDLESLLAYSKREHPKMVVFANPDNPTSTWHPLEEIERFLAQLPEDVVVLLDEAYIHFADWNRTALSLVKRYPNLMVMHTLSKAFGLAALRVGYVVCHPLLAREIEKIRLPFNLGLLPQKGATYRLQHPERVWKSVAIIQRERERLSSFLAGEGFWVLPAGGNFVFCDFGTGYERMLHYLEENGITVRSLRSFGFEPNHVRITVGGPSQMAYFRQVFSRAVRLAQGAK